MAEFRYDVTCATENFKVFLADEKREASLTNFQYVPCNIPGPGADLDIFDDTIDGCHCVGESCDISRDSTCNCVRHFGSLVDESGRVNMKNAGSPSGKLYMECNNLCHCTEKCNNRMVQKGIISDLEVFVDDMKGFSLRTRTPIEVGTFVCEYAGEIISASEARRRLSTKKSEDMNYIFALREHFSSGTICTYVDPKLIGNIGRFLNHSCDPNLTMIPIRVHTMVPKLCLFANKKIPAMEELVYDYSGGNLSTYTHADSKHLKRCTCSSEKCRGYLPFDEFAITE